MGALIKIITSLAGSLLPFLTKIFGGEKNTEYKAQLRLEEMRAFSSGRLTPRFLLFYALTGIFAIFAILFTVSIFFPSLINQPDFSAAREIIDMGRTLFED